jgi:hypothetical protein
MLSDCENGLIVQDFFYVDGETKFNDTILNEYTLFVTNNSLPVLPSFEFFNF